MFDINDWANLKVYMEYVLPLGFIGLVAVWYIFTSVMYKIKVFFLKSKHGNIKENMTSTYWSQGVCEDCGNVVYTVPTSVSSLSKEWNFNKNSFKCEG